MKCFSSWLGQVGLCAITSALTLFETVYATDLYAPRLEYAKKHGAIALPLEELKTALKEKTGGRGEHLTPAHGAGGTSGLMVYRTRRLLGSRWAP